MIRFRSSVALSVTLLLAACGQTSTPEPAPNIDDLLGGDGKADGTSAYVVEAELGGTYTVRLEYDMAEISPLNARVLRFEVHAGQHLVAVARKADASSIRPHLRLYWGSEVVVESKQQALLPMAADGDAAVAFTAPADGQVALYVADGQRNIAGSIQVDLVEMSTAAPVVLPEGAFDARREMFTLAGLEAEVGWFVERGLLSEVLDESALRAGDPRWGDLFADFDAYQQLSVEGLVSLEDWAEAANLASHATEVRRRYYTLSVELAGRSGAVAADAYGAYCAELWQTMRGAGHRLSFGE
ncbi:MAG: hypothetical protein JRH20_06845 [Deltaproteobacteria bacterium]|nr:hypothetical protein [Deltaproteobacteria bacterium]